jgi:hypothetical protein
MYAETAASPRAVARAYLTTPLRSLDAKGDLQCLFKSYDAACLDFDADAVAAFYDLPCLISTQGGNASFTARGELRAAMARVFTGYRQHGLVSASIAALEVATLTADFAEAQVVWSLTKARGVEVVSFSCRYTLRHADNRWRIAHAVALDEVETLMQPAPRAPLLRLSPRL